MKIPNIKSVLESSGGLYRKAAGNWAKVFSGNMASAILAIVAVSIAGRALGPETFGILVIVSTYVRLVDGLINFQSAQGIIKFGADALVANDRSGFLGLIRFGYALDAVTAACGTLLAATGLLLFIDVIGIGREYLVWGLIYCLLIPTNLIGAPMATLRLLDRFGLVVFRELSTQTLRVLGSLVLWFIDAPLEAYIVLWLSSEAAGNVLIMAMAARELRRRGYKATKPAALRSIPKRFEGLLPAILNTNLTTGIRLLSEQGDVLIVGSTLGTAAAAVYQIAKQFASALLRVGRPIQEAVYPDLARLWAEGQRQSFVRFAIRVGAFSGIVALGLCIALMIARDYLIIFTVGEEYLQASTLVVVLAFAHVVYLTGITVLPTTLTLKRSQDWLKVSLIATVVFFSMLPILIQEYGVIGAGIAHIAYNVVWLVLSVWFIRLALRREEASQELNTSKAEAAG